MSATKKLSRGDALAEAIGRHLAKWEEDRKGVNKPDRPNGTSRYYYAWARRFGSRIRVCYITYQGSSTLTLDDAAKYLAWIEAGNVGRHFEALRALRLADGTP